MIRSPAGFDGEIRIKRYTDYYQASYGVMMLSSGQFGAGTAAGYLLGSEPSGYATDFTAGGVQGSALVRSSPANNLMNYSGAPFQVAGGPINFTRGSFATVTDSDGLIKWAPHNLLLASEQFDTTSWTKSSATVAANTEKAPNGTDTADTIAASGANGTALQSYTAEAVPYTFGVWLKRKTGTGAIEIAADNGTYTAVTITSDWALYTVTQTPAAGSKSAGIRIVTSADEVYAWGAYLYRSDLGGMQANASAYPYYNPSTPKNLLGFTELLTTGWTNTNTTDSQVAEAAPNGSANSIEVTATAGNGTLLASLSLLASSYTFSVWLKRKTGTGTVEITVDGTTYTTAAVTSDWQRFSTTFTPSAGTKTPGIRLVTSGDAVYAWGAQLSDSASLDPYVPNFGAAPSAAAAYGPRLDYDPVTLAAKGLLVEEQSANIFTYSDAFNDPAWPTNNATVTANAIVALDGNLTGDKLAASNGATDHYIQNTASGTSGVRYAFSVYAKADEVNQVRLRFAGVGAFTSGRGAFFTLTGSGTVGPITGTTTATITLVGNGWYRVTITAIADATNTIVARISPATGDNSGYNNNGAGIYLWGAQLEAGSFATSYIPTAAATVTRNADVASVGVSQFPYSTTASSIVANVSLLSTAPTTSMFALSDGTINNFINTYQTVGTAFAQVYSGGAPQAVITRTTVSAGVQTKTGIAVTTNDAAFVLNGGAAGTDTSVTMPSAAANLYLGLNFNGSSNPLNGHIRQITYIPRRITDIELQQRTT